MVREYKIEYISCWEPEDKSGEYVVIHPNGTIAWYKDGLRSRVDGPAFECDNADKEYWYDGKIYPDIQSDEEWKEFLKLKFLW